MKLSEGYNSAVAQYGADIVNKISQAGISKNYWGTIYLLPLIICDRHMAAFLT